MDEERETAPVWLADHFSPQMLADRWNLSVDTVQKLFIREEGVLVISPPRRRGVRTKRTLRIPGSVVDRVYARLCNGGSEASTVGLEKDRKYGAPIRERGQRHA